MPILLVAATKFEIEPLLAAAGLASNWRPATVSALWSNGPDVDVLITGVGQLQCAYHLGVALTQKRYDMAFNIGIAGSFRQEFPKRSVVSIIQEELADLGAEDRDERLDLFQMGLLQPDLPPFSGGALRAPVLDFSALKPFPRVRAITVNRVLGSTRSIEQVAQRYAPDVVSMEGAAFFYACLSAGVPFIALRSISDFVTPRDKSAWDIPGAIAALCESALPVLMELRSGNWAV
jgi:futalosine hydrolase